MCLKLAVLGVMAVWALLFNNFWIFSKLKFNVEIKISTSAVQIHVKMVELALMAMTRTNANVLPDIEDSIVIYALTHAKRKMAVVHVQMEPSVLQRNSTIIIALVVKDGLANIATNEQVRLTEFEILIINYY